jgi:hypothetical protein
MGHSDQLLHGLEQELWLQWFDAELDAQTLVFHEGIFHSTDDQDRNRRMKSSHFPGEGAPIHPGHDVICDDEINA